jgi:hypothetical protein
MTETDYSNRILEFYKALRAHELMLNQATAAFERAALQPLFLLNGGAVAAFLALLGSTFVKQFSTINLVSVRMAVLGWCFGLLLAAVATIFGYLSQRRFSMWGRSQREKVEAGIVEVTLPNMSDIIREMKTSAKENLKLTRAKRLQAWAYRMSGLSLISFVFGALCALQGVAPW